MKRSFVVTLTVFLCLFSTISTKADDFQIDSSSFGKIFLEGGYKGIHEALQESKAHFKRDIALPTQLPPTPFTHHFGRFSDLKGDMNDEFEIEYLNKDSSQNHYVIRVKPVEYRLELKEENIQQFFNLNNGTEAAFSTKPLGMNFLLFENDGWQYMLLVDKRISDIVTPEVLVEIANSVK
ncbi:hypothetical protein [Sporosarcina sp. NPDC096371]|uniref:hypothetical protein n=1 Tax=Sporosarcina sp. NPDC096371 TaxID=3364530 RepID=UPI0038286A64